MAYENEYKTEGERNAYAAGFTSYAEPAGSRDTEALFDNTQARIETNANAMASIVEEASGLQKTEG